MSTNLILCVSQKENIKSYRFKLTGVNVYSFEEAVYHCYFNWKQSVDDFISDEFINWVDKELELSHLASQIRGFSRFASLSRKFVSFLSLIDYLNNEQIETLRKDISIWEKRNEWEKLKERGDYFMNRNEPGEALHFYKMALELTENPELLNNAAVSLMKIGNYAEAVDYLGRALKLRHNDFVLSLHIAEAYMLNGEYSRATDVLEKLLEEKSRKNDKIGEAYYYLGEIHFRRNKYIEAAEFYDKAANCAKTDEFRQEYLYKLSDAYIKVGDFSKVFYALEKIGGKEGMYGKDGKDGKDGKYGIDDLFYRKLVEAHILHGDIQTAVDVLEKAVLQHKNSAELWILLASCYRLKTNFHKAEESATKAVNLAPDDERVNLEYARIKKAQGKIKDYQIILNSIIDRSKEKYLQSSPAGKR